MTDPRRPPPTPLDYGSPTPRTPPSFRKLINWGGGWGGWAASIGISVLVLLLLVVAAPLSTNASRELKRQRQCAANLRQIGGAIQTYCHDHGGRFPDTLATLVRQVPGLSPAALCCPDDDDTPAVGGTRAAVADAVAAGGHCSYVYVGRGLTTSTATASTVVAYEPASPTVGHENGCNLLWGDGHADWHQTADAARVLPAGAVGPWVRPGATSRPGVADPGHLQIR